MVKETCADGGFSLVQLTALIRVVVTLRILVLRLELDHVVDAQNSDGRLGGKLKRLDLGDGRLENTRLSVIANDTF